jgi:hypothetical protein
VYGMDGTNRSKVLPNYSDYSRQVRLYENQAATLYIYTNKKMLDRVVGLIKRNNISGIFYYKLMSMRFVHSMYCMHKRL